MRYLKNVVTLKLESDKYIGCGICANVCPHGVFSIDNGKANIIDRDLCMECGACEKNCPIAAIAVRTGVDAQLQSSTVCCEAQSQAVTAPEAAKAVVVNIGSGCRHHRGQQC